MEIMKDTWAWNEDEGVREKNIGLNFVLEDNSLHKYEHVILSPGPKFHILKLSQWVAWKGP